MYSKLTLARKFLHYYLTASNGKGHGIHSPFIFQFVREILNDRKPYYAYTAIENERKRRLNDPGVVMVDDKGAGSAVTKSAGRRISQIARTALKPPKFGQLLFRMVNFYQPASILELGTSLGITTAYLALARPDAKVITLEGADAIADKAIDTFSRLNLLNIQLLRGDFNEMLLPALKELSAVDLAFIDGNHRKEPTVGYFHEILKHSHSETILVFDDIHWSSEMEEAWEVIKLHPRVRCTVDLFFLGLVFFREEFKVPQHFRVRF